MRASGGGDKGVRTGLRGFHVTVMTARAGEMFCLNVKMGSTVFCESLRRS